MIRNLFLKLGLIGAVTLLLFSCGEGSMGNGEPTTREKLIGVWSNYYLGTYEFCPDGTFMYEVENSGYYLFGNWTIEGGDLVIYYEGDPYEWVYEITELEDFNLILCQLTGPSDVCEEYERL